VLLLHGFAESFHMWRSQVAALAAAGYRAVAPSQRGYSPGARPDLSSPANYHMDRLVADAMDVVAACGDGGRRFHLVGHDWGASIAWDIASRSERLASLAVLSRPHPNAFNRALALPDGDQARRSSVQGVSSPMQDRVTTHGCASGWPNPAFRQLRSSGTSPCWATHRRWKRADVVPARRIENHRHHRRSGALRGRRRHGRTRRQRAPANSCPARIGSKSVASVTSPPTRVRPRQRAVAGSPRRQSA
jgi:pimeloyl-ACP methyl ester carboxylesterase